MMKALAGARAVKKRRKKKYNREKSKRFSNAYICMQDTFARPKGMPSAARDNRVSCIQYLHMFLTTQINKESNLR